MLLSNSFDIELSVLPHLTEFLPPSNPGPAIWLPPCHPNFNYTRKVKAAAHLHCDCFNFIYFLCPASDQLASF